jgi:hypothetical protein
MGDVRRVTVVTSLWHVRARWFFAPYRRFGLGLSHSPVVAHGNWARMLAAELRGIPHAPAERRAAMAAVHLTPQLRLEAEPADGG